MESTYWMRLGFILALLLGSIYVLMPTLLETDTQTRLKDQIAQVQEPVETGPDLTIRFTLDRGDADQIARALDARLDAAGVPNDRVEATDEGVTVHLGLGGSRADVERLAATTGAVRWFAPEAVVAEPDAGPAPTDLGALVGERAGADRLAGVAALAGRSVPAGATSFPVEATIAGSGEGLTAAIPALPAEVGYLVLAVDDRVAGIAVPAAEGPATLRLLGGDADLAAILASGPLDGQLQAVPAPTVTDAAPVELPQATTESNVPPWLQGMMPSTQISLGLDLQGGLDLTLQVELEAAVLSQVGRDQSFIREQAERDAFPMQVRRDRTRPVLKFSSEKELGELKEYLRTSLRDYAYRETLTDDDGTRWHVFFLNETREKEIQDQAVEQVLETLRKRVDSTGVKEPSIVKMGGGRINIQMPGVADIQSALQAIGTQAELEFRLEDWEFDPAELSRILRAAEDALPADQFAEDDLLNHWLWETGRLPEQNLVLWEYAEGADGRLERTRPLVLHNEILLTGGDVNNAGVAWNDTQQPYVSLEFKPRGSSIFCDVTTENVGRNFAIILDDQIRSAPVIRSKICGGRASIEMGSSAEALDDANNLALVLRTGALAAPVSVAEHRIVGASLGEDAIRAGEIGTMIGAAFVLIFMVWWYKLPGLIADGALILNVIMVFALMAIWDATLTLPGFAGIALTIGMAVDANIIIYERIREELALGVNARKAVDTGYDKGLSAILDANITTAIAGVVLYSYGTGPVKGFAVTLLIGIFTTLVTALFVTRTFMELSTRSSTARLRF